MEVKAKPEGDGYSFLRHSEENQPDFSGWATKSGIKCSDGRTITSDAFKHQDQMTVPLVWQHGHKDSDNVLGYAILEHREGEGVYAYGFFNDTDKGQNAKKIVIHGDVKSLSIYANQLVEKSKNVIHGVIKELSLVLSGANPGALIDYVAVQHSDGDIVTLDDEAVIYTGLELEHADDDLEDDLDDAAEVDDDVEHADDQGPSIQDIYDTMNDDQKQVVNYMVGAALEAADGTDAPDAAHSDTTDQSPDDTLVHGDDTEEGRHMTRNVFEQQNGGATGGPVNEHALSHDGLMEVVASAKQRGSLKDAFEHYALQHGIEDIDLLFPDARLVTDTPEFESRRTEWVADVLNGTKHSPFTRIKSLVADITFDEARAKGYIKGNLKKEEWFGVSKRTTTPSTVYKKQKLDRDDILDITDFDVVLWLKAEMRLMLDEEIAGAILIGDGRDVDDEDKIKDPQGSSEGAGIRSILHDHDMYAATKTVDDSATSIQIVDGIVEAMKFYKGSGNPTFYTTLTTLTSLLLTRDQFGHRMWKSKEELAAELGLAAIVTVEIMEREEDLIGIVVNLKDYTVGTDKGGDVSFFDDFDIDYNQYKYLYETRLSGALTKIRSALIIMKAEAGGVLVTPADPTYADGVVTINATTHVTYKNAVGDVTVTGTITLDEGESVTIYAVPASGYFFDNNVEDQWTFTNNDSA